MNVEKLKKHIKLCKSNLKSTRVKCCATCPFEEEITDYYPETKKMFDNKKEYVKIKWYINE